MPGTARVRVRVLVPIALAGVILAALAGWAPAAPTGRASASRRVALYPAADSYVAAGHATHNLGRLPLLAVRRHPAMRAYVRFVARSSTARVRKATLYLYSLRDARHGLRVRRTSNLRWNERAITWRHMPRVSRSWVRSGPLHRDAWTAVDVTSLLDGDRTAEFGLTGMGSDRVLVRSKEAGYTAPRLVLDYTTSTTVPTGPRPAPRPAPGTTTGPAPGPAGTPAPSPPPNPTPGVTPTSARPCGVSTAPPVSGWQHVVWIVMENKTYSNIIGNSGAPNINALAGKCGLATNFFAESHPSLPNYIAMTSGSTQGISDDSGPSSHHLTVPSIFSQLGAGGWRSLEENMPSNCAQGDSGDYAVRHNPAAYYTNISAQCATQDVALGATPDLSARFTFITPNECHDMHSSSCASDSAGEIRAGDTWLGSFMPKVLDSPQYKAGNTVVFLTWDEDDYSADQHIATIVMSPSTPVGAKGGTKFDHYSMLRTTEEILGVAPLGSAAGAATMKADFDL